MAKLDSGKQLVSDLWLDQPDAHDKIDERLQAGDISADEAEKLRHFTDEGYLTLSLDLDEKFFERFDAEVEHLWVDRPVDLAAAAKGSGKRISFRDFDEASRTAGYRIADPHTHLSTASDLYHNPQLFRMVELIFGQRGVAFQSLYFQYGSQQSLHRDPMFVATRPPSHLLAAWIALEDIVPGSGPLLYAPRSHRMPWFEFADDTIAAKANNVADGKRGEWAQFRRRMVRELDLKVEAFTPKRGNVLMWHGGLLHGGERVKREDATRKSFVVHYSTAANYASRTARMKMRFDKDGEEVWRTIRGETDQVIEKNGCLGLDSPLRHANIPATT